MVLEAVEEKGERTDGAAAVKRGTALVDGVLPALPRSPVDCVEVLEVLEVVDTEVATSSSVSKEGCRVKYIALEYLECNRE